MLVQSKLSILRAVDKHEPSLAWEWLWTKAILDWSQTQWYLEPYLQSVCRFVHLVAILGHEYIIELLKSQFKIRQSKIALKETTTLNLGHGHDYTPGLRFC